MQKEAQLALRQLYAVTTENSKGGLSGLIKNIFRTENITKTGICNFTSHPKTRKAVLLNRRPQKTQNPNGPSMFAKRFFATKNQRDSSVKKAPVLKLRSFVYENEK